MDNVHSITIVSKSFGAHKVYVDQSDVDLISRYSWCIAKRSDKLYCAARIGGKVILMHRFLLGLSDKDNIVDHKDGNGLNNIRSNIRVCTHSQNLMNRAMGRKTRKSLFKGVYWIANRSKWLSYISVNGVRSYGGVFINQIDAARSYNQLALRLHGEFAKLNDLNIGTEFVEKTIKNV